MPFNITNVLATFQRLINNILKEYLDVFYSVYLDNILIYLKDIKKHNKYIKLVLAALDKHYFKVGFKKYKFYKQETKFYSYIVTTTGIKVDLEKIKTILEQNAPTNKKKV